MFRAPLYFGVANVLRQLVQNQLEITPWQSFLLLSQLSPAFVSAWITYHQSYNFPDKARWWKQYALLWFAHGVTWLVTIRGLQKALV